MQNYNDLLTRIMEEGEDCQTRNAMTRSLFAQQLRFKMKDGFPAVTTKKLAFGGVKGELKWFLEGSTDDNRLKEILGKKPEESTIWTQNAIDPKWLAKGNPRFPGDLGDIYGAQWRCWKKTDGTTIDQIALAIQKIKEEPASRRIIVSAWNPEKIEIESVALPPCHILFQLKVINGKLSLAMTQRSCDMFLGVPFNIASYSLLLCMLAQVTGLEPYECILTLNDAHIYHEHFEAVATQLSRKPKKLPTLWLNPNVKNIDDFQMDDIRLENYESDDKIPARMIV